MHTRVLGSGVERRGEGLTSGDFAARLPAAAQKVGDSGAARLEVSGWKWGNRVVGDWEEE